MADTALDKFTQFQIAGIPLGQVAVGAGVAGLGDAVIGVVQSFAPQLPSWAFKGVAALGMVRWGKRLVGDQAAGVASLFLAYDAVQELFNIRQSVSNIVGGLLGGIRKASAPRFTGAGVGSVVAQAEQVVAGAKYYGQAGL